MQFYIEFAAEKEPIIRKFYKGNIFYYFYYDKNDGNVMYIKQNANFYILTLLICLK